MANDKIFRVRESFVAFEEDGTHTVVQAGSTIREGHRFIQGHEEFLEPTEVTYDVEDATSRPGQKRSSPKKTAASKGDKD